MSTTGHFQKQPKKYLYLLHLLFSSSPFQAVSTDSFQHNTDMEHPMEKSNEVLNLSINIPPTLPTQPKSETTPWEEHYRELQDLTREEEQALWAAGNSDIDNEDSFKSGAMLSRNSLSESVLGDDMLVEVSEDGFGSEGSLIDLGSDDESEADSESSAILVKGVKKDKGKAIDRQEYEDEFSLSLAAAGEIEVSETEKRKSVDTASTKTKPTLYKLPSADLTFAQRQTGCQQRSMDRAAMVGLKPIVSSSLFPSPKSADVKGESLKDDEVYMKGVFERAFMSFGTTREDIKLLVAAKEADRIVKENARKGMQPTVTDENEELAMETTASANKEEGEFTMYQHAASQVTINTGGSIKMDKELTWPPNYPEKWKPLQLDSQRRLSEATQNRFNIPNFGPRPEEKPQQKSQLQSGTNQKCFNISTFIPRPEEQSEANQPQINTSTFDPLHEKTPRKFQTKPFIALSPVGPALSPPVMKEIIEVSKSNRRRGNIGVKKHKLAREDAASAPSASSTSSITKNKITAESHCAICSQDILSPATMPGCLKYHKSPVSFSKLSQILAESKSHTDGDVNHSSICANNNSHADVPFINAKPSGNSTNRIFHPDLNPALPSFKTSYECHFHISSLSDCGAYSVRTCNASLETPDTTVGAPFPAFFHANKSAPVKNLSSKDSIDKPMNMLKNLRAAGIVQGSSPMATYTNLHGEVFTCNARSYTSCLNLECKLHPRSSDFIANLQVGQIQAQLQAQRQSQAQYQVQLQAQLQAQLQIEAQRSSLAKDKKKS